MSLAISRPLGIPAVAQGLPGIHRRHAPYSWRAPRTPLWPPISGGRDSEWTVGKPLLAKLNASTLCWADRGVHGYDSGGSAQATGSHLLWRGASNRPLPVTQALSDGSFLSVLRPSKGAQRKDDRVAVPMRVIDSTLPGTQGAETPSRLLTTLLNEYHALALEWAALYHERGEVEGVFDELKTH